ncbi:MAG: Gfo/Idh/MocA family oxidoreductase [Candidatus Bathyarchaeia archaeon]
MKRVRVGVAGAGGVFQGGHLPGYPDVEEAQLVALSDVAEETLKRAERRAQVVYAEKAQEAEKTGNLDLAERLKEDGGSVKTYKSVKEMLAREELDLVDVCTPTRYHDPVAIEALNFGVNVMVEKPMARTYLECLKVIEAVENSKRLYQHNENWLHDPFWYNVKKFIDGGAIGEVQLIFIAAAHGGPEGREWFWNPDIAGGGALLDNGVHAITTSWFLSGFEKKPVWVKAAEPYGISIRMKTRILGGRFRPVTVEDDAHVLIRYEDEGTGAWSTAHVEGSWSHQDSPDTSIIGTNGRMEPLTEEGKTFLKITDPKGAVRKIELVKPTWVLGIAGEIRNMCHCVLENVKPICDERIGAETTAIVDTAYLSQKRGKKAVTLDEFKEYAQKIQEKEGEKAPDILLKELLKGIRG